MMVRVGFFSLELVKQLPSVTKRFLTSLAWQKLFRTEVFGFLPMRIVPTSWLANPPGASPKSGNTSPFKFEQISIRPRFLSLHRATSFFPNRKCTTGIGKNDVALWSDKNRGLMEI